MAFIKAYLATILKMLNLIKCRPFCFTVWNWEELSDDNENDKGCDNGDFDESESFYAGIYFLN